MIWDGTFNGMDAIRRVHPRCTVMFMAGVERTIFYTRIYSDPFHGGPVLLVFEGPVDPCREPQPQGAFLPGEDVPDKIERPVMVTYP